MEVKKRHTAQVIFHASGGIRRNLKLKGGVPSHCVARAFSDMIFRKYRMERKTAKELHSATPAVREEILWK